MTTAFEAHVLALRRLGFGRRAIAKTLDVKPGVIRGIFERQDRQCIAVAQQEEPGDFIPEVSGSTPDRENDARSHSAKYEALEADSSEPKPGSTVMPDGVCRHVPKIGTVAKHPPNCCGVEGHPSPLDEVVSDARQIAEHREQLEVKRKYGRLAARYAELEQLLDAQGRVISHLEAARPAEWSLKAGRDSEATAFLVTGDWHLEEPVDPRLVGGLNEYNLTIAEERIKRTFTTFLSLMEMVRSKSHIDTAVVAVLGDLISGHIHDTLKEKSQLDPMPALIRAYEWLCAGLDLVRKEGKFQKILVPCCCGNHARITKDRRPAEGDGTNLEWLLYNFVAKRYANDPVIDVRVPCGYFHYLDVYGKTIRVHHGDSLQYGGGVGGIHVPLNKALDRWDAARKANLDILGHWHQAASTSRYVVNGSVIGYNPFAVQIKAVYEPPQQSFFLFHPKYGKSTSCPIVLA